VTGAWSVSFSTSFKELDNEHKTNFQLSSCGVESTCLCPVLPTVAWGLSYALHLFALLDGFLNACGVKPNTFLGL